MHFMKHGRWTGALLATALLTAPAIRAAEPTPALTETQIEDIVKRYLLKNGEVLLQSVQLYQERQRQAGIEKARQAIGERQKDLLQDPASPVLAPGAGQPVTIVAFLDYRCGYCKRVAPTIKALLEKNPDARVVIKELPILGPDSLIAAKAALAAHKQGAYKKFHEAIFGLNEPVSAATVESTAQSLGLNAEQLRKDMDSPEIEKALERNRDLAQALGVNSTPTFIVGKELVAGAMNTEAFQDLLDRTRKAVAKNETAGPRP